MSYPLLHIYASFPFRRRSKISSFFVEPSATLTRSIFGELRNPQIPDVSMTEVLQSFNPTFS